jgi:hypothetical protein
MPRAIDEAKATDEILDADVKFSTTAISAPPRLEPKLIERLIAADLEVVRLLDRLRGLRRRLDRPGARPAAASAYQLWAGGRYEEALGGLRAARTDAQTLLRGDGRGGLSPAA